MKITREGESVLAQSGAGEETVCWSMAPDHAQKQRAQFAAAGASEASLGLLDDAVRAAKSKAVEEMLAAQK